MTASAKKTPPVSSIEPSLVSRWWLALGLTVVLSAAWVLNDWQDLFSLRLPDNDDVARLQQVRDWLAGQAFNDLMQYRSGPPGGASMHWSRIADAGPAFLLLLLTPFLGTHTAEVAVAVLYPAALFFLYLLLVARIAVRLADERARIPGLVLAALAFPTISLFLPGRIDHHGLQIVLTVLLLDTTIAPATLKRGFVAGLAAAASLAIGLETAPEVLAAMVVLGLRWLWGNHDEDRRALGFAAALSGATLLLLAFARPHVWPEQWCDGFTPSSTRATLVLAAAWGGLGLAGLRLSRLPHRLAAAVPIGLSALFLVLLWSPACFAGPYGALDPFLAQVWMRNVGEARGLLQQEMLATSLGFGGLIVAGTVLALLHLRGDGRWLGFTVFLVLGTVASIAQIRVTYIMAGIAVVPFACGLARVSSGVRRIGFWVLGAGIVWNLAALATSYAAADPAMVARKVQNDCTRTSPFLVIARLQPGRIMAPLELDSYLLALTPHHVIASLYHRNNAGNLAMYSFFLSPPGRAYAQAKREGVKYVALCHESLQENGLTRYRTSSLVAEIQSGRVPQWLEPIQVGGAIMFYRVR